MTTESNKELVRKFLHCFSTRDVATAAQLTTDDLKWWMGGRIELFPLIGGAPKNAISTVFDELLPETRHGLAVEPLDMIAEGDKVACEAVTRGELGNARSYSNEYHLLFTFRDGKIASVKEYVGMLYAGGTSRP
ncbi:hypothetical protein DFR24_4482 [Panacagrimonas perspica]|uniref:SnoaL-like domain-containing protein n=1 Tax=Panacagrimonas perspica TaxID=381431 RepID=A0A4S3K8Q4_9GAMM|nr:nuclear transport factor 2 family protein [Panacagrimonas perspica]TDU24217.1 hypothetical protein DFR24_4482 [Panacagrimonas perspica]THD04626.1 hypothetical protein B1810_04205 [Panacagrimonas perspica]